ncbi:MAG: hypothetical protein JNK87_08740, partial [Bryobacterales bacterium]|nr:hypothetical protein [Bryobacterales bacterium]
MKSLAVTFYSYKGGVGRTLAMLNTAQALVRLRKKVFLWELDLEAPGLLQIPQFDSLRPKVAGGTLDILATPAADLKAQIQHFVLTHSDGLL